MLSTIDCSACQTFKAPNPSLIQIGDLLTLYDDQELPKIYGLVSLITKNQKASSKQQHNFEISLLLQHPTAPGCFRLNEAKPNEAEIEILSDEDMPAVASVSKWSDYLESPYHDGGWKQLLMKVGSVLATFNTTMEPKDGLQCVVIVVRSINRRTNGMCMVSFKRLRRDAVPPCTCTFYEEAEMEVADLKDLKGIYKVASHMIGAGEVLLPDKIWWSVDVSSLERVSHEESDSVALAAPTVTSPVALAAPTVTSPAGRSTKRKSIKAPDRHHSFRTYAKQPCTICLGIYDLSNLKQCCVCSAHIHWYCDASAFVLPATTDDDRWLCRGCSEELAGDRSTSAEATIDIRVQQGSDAFQFLNRGQGWTSTEGEITPKLLMRMAQRQKQLASGIEVISQQIRGSPGWHEMCIRQNGTRLGLRQTIFLRGISLSKLEANVLQVSRRDGCCCCCCCCCC